jgi:VIT1/CCC1 family predicted Fe2+/Mn2+ transporter
MSTNDLQTPFNLSSHELLLAITWSILFTSSGVFPILLYFFLKDVAHLKHE